MTVAFICSRSPTFVMFWQDTFSSASCQFAPAIGRCKKPPNIVTINGALINTASRFVGMRIPGWGIKFPQCGIMCRSPRRRNCASLVNIAHLHVRFARQASERDSQLGATITLTRPQPARLILMSCGIASPTRLGPALPKVVLPMCCSRVLVVRVERSRSNVLPGTIGSRQ
jgi:hypothetical protein